MSQSFHNVNSKPLLYRLDQLSIETNETFGTLTQQQLVWKSAKGQWSVRECLDHIMTTNRQYYLRFDKIAAGNYVPAFWEKMPSFLHSFWARQLVPYLGPDVKRKSKTPAIFRPSSGRLSASIAKDFVLSLKQLANKIEAMDGIDHSVTIITSPVSKVVTYSLYDALEIIVGHAERHVNQAKRVMEQPGFPTA